MAGQTAGQLFFVGMFAIWTTIGALTPPPLKPFCSNHFVMNQSFVCGHGCRLAAFLLVTVSLLVAAGPMSAQEAVALPTAEAVQSPKPASGEPTPAASIASAVPAIRPLSVTVDLVDGQTQLVGTLTDKTSLDMKTSFGTVDVPLSEVAGFRFPSADDVSTTVVMLNGDSITGATDIKLLTVETEWGVAQINGQSIQSILFVPSLKWTASKGLNGKRWSLTESKPQTSTPGSAIPAPSRAAPTNRPQLTPALPQFNRRFGN